MRPYYTQIAHTSPTVISLDDAKKQLKMEDLGTFDDAIIQDCIDAAIDEAESYIEANIRERKYSIRFQSWMNMYEFREQKIQTIDSINYKTDASDVNALVVADNVELLPVDKYASIIRFLDYDALPDLKDLVSDAVTINITVGYAATTVPKGLIQGVKLLVSENYNIRNNVESKSFKSTAYRKLEAYKYYKTPISE